MQEEIFDYHLDGVLDQHMFHPRDVRPARIEYLPVCREKAMNHG